MVNERFDFTTESLSYNIIEDIILRHYDLGYAYSSTFMDLPEGCSSSHSIIATQGIIKFSVIVNKNKDGSYLVICYPNSLKKEI